MYMCLYKWILKEFARQMNTLELPCKSNIGRYLQLLKYVYLVSLELVTMVHAFNYQEKGHWFTADYESSLHFTV